MDTECKCGCNGKETSWFGVLVTSGMFNYQFSHWYVNCRGQDWGQYSTSPRTVFWFLRNSGSAELWSLRRPAAPSPSTPTDLICVHLSYSLLWWGFQAHNGENLGPETAPKTQTPWPKLRKGAPSQMNLSLGLTQLCSRARGLHFSPQPDALPDAARTIPVLSWPCPSLGLHWTPPFI